MIIRHLLLIVLVAVCVYSLPAAGKRYAVLIGINDYMDAGILDLRTARNDVADLAKSLAGWDKVFLMSDDLDLRGPDAPVRSNIENRLSLLADLTSPGDAILVFFSGHGFTDAKGDARLLPLDASVNRLTETSISVADISIMLNSKGQRNVVFMLDACREALAAAKGLAVVGVGGSAQGRNAALDAFYATQSGWYSYEDAGGRNGVFTRFLLEGLAGSADLNHDGKVSTGELSAWLPGAAGDYALSKGIRQKPYTSIPDEAVKELALVTGAVPATTPRTVLIGSGLAATPDRRIGAASNLTPELIFNFDSKAADESGMFPGTEAKDVVLDRGRDGSTIAIFNGKSSRIHVTTSDPEYLYQSSFFIRFKLTGSNYWQAFLDCDGLQKNGMHFQMMGKSLEFVLDGTVNKAHPAFSFDIGIWYNVALVCDLPRHSLTVYVDGKKIFSDTAFTGQPIRLENFSIGAWDREDRYFTGMLDYFYVYNGVADESIIALAKP